MSLDLFIDPFETDFPGLVVELLSHPTGTADRPPTVACSVTGDGFAYLIFNKNLYVWNYRASACGGVVVGKPRPHAYTLNLPRTGLTYSTSNVVVFGETHPSVLVVSPEGHVRYWDTVGSVPRDVETDLKNEVVLSVQLFSSELHVRRFLITTTTRSLLMVDVFKDVTTAATTGTIICRNIGSTSTARPWGSLFGMLGSARTSHSLVKSLFVKEIFPGGDVQNDLMFVYQREVALLSANSGTITRRFDVASAVFREFRGDKSATSAVVVTDAVVYERGVLLLIPIVPKAEKGLVELGFGLISEQSLAQGSFEWFEVVNPADLIGCQNPDHTIQLPKMTLHAPIKGSIVVVLPRSVISLQNIRTNLDILTDVYPFEEDILGSACTNNFCQVITRQKAICNIRWLPSGFDVNFWGQFHAAFEPISQRPIRLEDHIRTVFALFASKNLPEARARYTAMLAAFDDSADFANTVVRICKEFVDAVPVKDSRWNKDPEKRLKSEIPDHLLVKSQLEDKIALYNMTIIFLRYFGLLDKLNVKTPSGRTALSIVAEYGEKLTIMTSINEVRTTAAIPIVRAAVKNIGGTIRAQLGFLDNPYLGHWDFFAKEVTSLDALFPELMRMQQKELDDRHRPKTEILNEISAIMVNSVIVALGRWRAKQWVVALSDDDVPWTSAAPVLSQFNRQFDLVFDAIDAFPKPPEKVLLQLAHFILGHQSRHQRNNSEVIQRFYQRDNLRHIAIQLAETYHDFSTLITYCHSLPDKRTGADTLEVYKNKYRDDNFETFLFEYYHQHGDYAKLLSEEGSVAENFIARHEEIRWMKSIEKGDYRDASETLRAIAFTATTAPEQNTALALAKLAALCADDVDDVVVAQISSSMTLLQHQARIDPEILAKVNPTNAPMSVEEIVMANLQESSFKGFLRALIALTAVLETGSGFSAVGSETVERLRTLIYAELVQADPWTQIAARCLGRSDEQMNSILASAIQDSIFATTLDELNQVNIPQDVKSVLVPASTEFIKAAFPLKNNRLASDIFGNFVDTTFEEIRNPTETAVDAEMADEGIHRRQQEMEVA